VDYKRSIGADDQRAVGWTVKVVFDAKRASDIAEQVQRCIQGTANGSRRPSRLPPFCEVPVGEVGNYSVRALECHRMTSGEADL